MNDFAGKDKADTTGAKVLMPHPPPLVPQRPAMPGELPAAALRLVKAAVAAQWSVAAFYAVGWCVDTGGHVTGKLKASVLLRLRRGEERACAVWSTPWPAPAGVEPPGLHTPPEIASHLPRSHATARLGHLRELRLAPLRAPVTVKWAYDLGAYWVRGRSPLAPRLGTGTHGWWGAAELRTAVSA